MHDPSGRGDTKISRLELQKNGFAVAVAVAVAVTVENIEYCLDLVEDITAPRILSSL
jgi:hypothetical protein